jgi:hypothetical protein
MAPPVFKYRGNDPWERPLRYVPQDKLKKQGKEEKEARLLVACWQGRDDEVKRIFDSGKPQARSDCSENVREDREYRFRGKAQRASTKVQDLKFVGNDLYRFGTPLHKAALRGDVKLVEMLLEHLAGPSQILDDKTEVGNTALHHAAHRGHVQVCEALLDALSDVTVCLDRPRLPMSALLPPLCEAVC